MPQTDPGSQMGQGPGASEKVYILVRSDLSMGAQIVQAAHAMSLFHSLDEQAFHHWQSESHFLVILAVAGQEQLLETLKAGDEAGAVYAVWREPDYGNEFTSAVIAPGETNSAFLGALPLAGRTPAPAGAVRRECDLKRHSTNTEPVEVVYHRNTTPGEEAGKM